MYTREHLYSAASCNFSLNPKPYLHHKNSIAINRKSKSLGFKNKSLPEKITAGKENLTLFQNESKQVKRRKSNTRKGDSNGEYVQENAVLNSISE